jgi:glycosyltransferase involved in cell wall biosynthesis
MRIAVKLHFGKPVLSVLICHLRERADSLNRLLKTLHDQTAGSEQVEIILCDDPRGSMSIGAKRNLLVGWSAGEYVAFIDDDDNVSDTYIAKILKALRRKPDCVGITGKYIVAGQPEWTFRHSITVSRWCRDKVRRIYFRTPNHLNPVRRDIAISHPFPDIQFGEDRVFSDSIKIDLHDEVFIEDPIYYYYYDNNK